MRGQPTPTWNKFGQGNSNCRKFEDTPSTSGHIRASEKIFGQNFVYPPKTVFVSYSYAIIHGKKCFFHHIHLILFLLITTFFLTCAIFIFIIAFLLISSPMLFCKTTSLEE